MEQSIIVSNDLCSKSVQISWITSLLSSSFDGTSSQYTFARIFNADIFWWSNAFNWTTGNWSELYIRWNANALIRNCGFLNCGTLWYVYAALYYVRSIAMTFLELSMHAYEFNWWNDMSITIIIGVKLRTVIIQLTIWFNAAQKIVNQRMKIAQAHRAPRSRAGVTTKIHWERTIKRIGHTPFVMCTFTSVCAQQKLRFFYSSILIFCFD